MAAGQASDTLVRRDPRTKEPTMKLSTLAIALTLCVASTAALACCDEDKAGDSHRMHRKMDLAAMSPADRQKRMDEMFATIDANKDGSISKAEFTRHHEAMMAKRHDRMMERHEEHMDHDKMKMEDKPASGK
jgi:hypothetical protein